MSTNDSTNAWVYVRGGESVRVIVDGTEVAVYGPGGRFSHSRFDHAMDAALHQAAVEQSLVLDGWTLEELTTEHRSGSERRTLDRGGERRRHLRIVKPPGR